MIQTKDLHIGYKSAILEVSDLHLKKGCTYVLLGKNGSGKSTFLKTLSGQIKPIQGTCIIDEQRISEISHKELPKLISFVSSKLGETDYLTAKEYISLGRAPYTNGLGRVLALDEVKIVSAIEKLGLELLKDRFINELSDGEKQLVAIAKALAQETDVILLDEPTAFLDYTNKVKIMNRLTEVAEEYGKCIIMSSHDLDVSINSNCPFLVVDQSENRLIELPKESTRQDLIDKAY